MLTQARRQMLTAGMIFALGFALVLGGCGHQNQNSQNGANQPTNSTTQQGGTTTGGTTGGGTSINTVQDLQNLDNSLSTAFSDLEGDRTTAATDYSQLDQGGQP